MQQEDYFKRQLDQFGKALAGILARFTGLDHSLKSSLGMEMIESFFSEQLNTDLKAIAQIQREDFVRYLLEDLSIRKENLESIARLLESSANVSKDEENFLEKSLQLLTFIQKNSTDYDVERDQSIKNLTSRIQELKLKKE